MDINRLKSSPITFGIVLGIAAAFIQLLIRDRGPLAYGVCTICHSRDLLRSVIAIFSTVDMDQPAFANSAFVLTPVGLIAGSFFASKRNGEFKPLRVENPLFMVVYGIIVSVFGLLIMSCPTRIILRVSFGDSFGLLAAVGLFWGVGLAVLLMKRRF